MKLAGDYRTDQEFTDYITSNYLPRASAQEIAKLEELYPAGECVLLSPSVIKSSSML
jgi:hypothetical protein